MRAVCRGDGDRLNADADQRSGSRTLLQCDRAAICGAGLRDTFGTGALPWLFAVAELGAGGVITGAVVSATVTTAVAVLL